MGRAPSGQESGSGPKGKSEGETAFGRLAGYIFGKNSRQEKMSMTAPVFSHPNGRLQFVMDSSHQVGTCHYIGKSIFLFNIPPPPPPPPPRGRHLSRRCCKKRCQCLFVCFHPPGRLQIVMDCLHQVSPALNPAGMLSYVIGYTVMTTVAHKCTKGCMHTLICADPYTIYCDHPQHPLATPSAD